MWTLVLLLFLLLLFLLLLFFFVFFFFFQAEDGIRDLVRSRGLAVDILLFKCWVLVQEVNGAGDCSCI